MIYIVSLDYFPDINECESSPCHNSIGCTNTPGSYVCNCSSGYQGIGTRCQGKKPFYFQQYVIYKLRFLYALRTFQSLTITTYPYRIRLTSTVPDWLLRLCASISPLISKKVMVHTDSMSHSKLDSHNSDIK